MVVRITMDQAATGGGFFPSSNDSCVLVRPNTPKTLIAVLFHVIVSAKEEENLVPTERATANVPKETKCERS